MTSRTGLVDTCMGFSAIFAFVLFAALVLALCPCAARAHALPKQPSAPETLDTLRATMIPRSHAMSSPLLLGATEDTTSASVTVTWNDGDNIDRVRPNYIELRVLRSTDAGTTWHDSGMRLVVTGNDADNTWYGTASNLPTTYNDDPVEYSFRAVQTPVYYSASGVDTLELGFSHTLSPAAYGTVDVPATVTWDDKDNRDALRPNYIDLVLYTSTDGQIWSESDEFLRLTGTDAESTWTGVAEGLSKVNGHCHELFYAFLPAGLPEEYTGASEPDTDFTFVHAVDPNLAPVVTPYTLRKHAAAVQLVAAAATVSTDGSDLPTNAMWVKAATRQMLYDVVESAVGAADDMSSTQVQLDNADRALALAVEEYQQALAPGLVGKSFTANAAAGALKYRIGSGKTATLSGNSSTNTKTASINSVTYKGISFKVTAIASKALAKAKCASIKLGANVEKIGSSALSGAAATKLTVKSSSLSKSSVKGCLKGSKVQTVRVKVSSNAKTNKRYVKEYAGIFTKANCGKNVTVK